MSLCILLIEDDAELRGTLRDALLVEGHRVRTAASMADGLAQLHHAQGEHHIDMVLLDLGLPDGDGLSVLTQLRRRASLPVIVISARHDEAGKIHLLDAGADDYLTKPFSIGELLARIRVAMRHRGAALAPAVTRYAHGDLHVDLTRREVMLRGEAVHLTPTEYALLARLVRSAGQVVTHRQLLADVWGAEHIDQTHYLRLYMAQLRGKLEAHPAEPVLLLTEAGVGYRLVENLLPD
ncbi:MAG: response regulator [Aquabacterium sp.]